ncbi:MAG: redoxin domain-containing protein [Flavobacterium sp.]|nr:redoxin domain-containing protein [Flavobacterium sp.]
MRFLVIVLWLLSYPSEAQTITAHFPQAANREVRLAGFTFAASPVFSQATADASGNFKLQFPKEYSGAALLEIKGMTSVIVLLNNENLGMIWPNLTDYNSVSFTGSAENNAFNGGLAIYRESNAKKLGLTYLLPMYVGEDKKQQFFESELQFQRNAMSTFLSSIPENAYSRYYLQIRSFLSDLQQVAKGSGEVDLAEFYKINFSDLRLERSGLTKELLDAYFLVAEAQSQNVAEVKKAIDHVLLKISNPELKQDVAEHLFKNFEQQSLFQASEYVAFSMLNSTDCTLDGRREALFEQYRKMAKGQIAPEITFVNSNKNVKHLSQVGSKYKLVVFGAGWCPSCQEELPKLQSNYDKWKTKNLEIVYISLDTDAESYKAFTANSAWITSSDYKSWEGQAARDYYISGTPTMYLLDRSNRILLKPVSPDQVSAWLEMQN